LLQTLAASRAGGYLAAVLLIGLFLIARLALEPWLGLHVPYLQVFPTILLFALTALVIGWLGEKRRESEASRVLEAARGKARADRLDAIINTTVDGIIVIDDRGRIESLNRGGERIFGYAESEAIGRNVNMLMASPYHEEHDGYLQRYLATGVPKIIGAGRSVMGRRRDGSTFPLHLSVGEMTIGGERKFTGMLHDLTVRGQLEEQLRSSEARWRSIIDSAVDGIVVIDQFGRVEAFNPAAERLFGYAESDIVGQNVNTLMPSPYHEEHDRYLARYLATGTAKIIGVGREVTGRRRDGTTFPVHLSVGHFTIKGERKFTGILHDLSGRVRLEENLRERAALAHLGEMAAVIAHEVRNPLAGIKGAIQTFATRLPADSGDSRMVKEIESRIDSLNEMMKDLLLFARPPQPRPRPTEIVSLVRMTARLLVEDPALRDVQIEVAGSSTAIPADAEMLKIVFQNLLVNGAHAMGGQGLIRVDVTTVDTSCLIAFTDQGPGIPVAVRERIFTPFFTTKVRGSGLGLPTARRLVEAQNGGISIDCPSAGGTTVTVTLPLTAPLLHES
jgi:PAS domain S-box-containing protein